jgi:hypothetical protein
MRFNKNNIIDKAKNSINLINYLLTPINALIFTSTVLGARAMKKISKWLYYKYCWLLPINYIFIHIYMDSDSCIYFDEV